MLALLELLNLFFLQSEKRFLPRRKGFFIKRPVPFNAILGQFGELITLAPVHPRLNRCLVAWPPINYAVATRPGIAVN